MSDIFREVDQDLRQERYKALWQRYGWIVIALALAIVIGVGGYRFWDWYQTRQAAQSGEAFLDAVDVARAGDHGVAAEAFGALADRGGDTALLARFRAASAQASAGDVAGAIAGFDAIAGDTGADELVRQAAAIRAGYLLIDTASPEEVAARIGDLTEDNSPFQAMAHEIIGATAYRVGALDDSRRAYAAITGDLGAPVDLRRRAERMLGLLAGQGVGAPATEEMATPAGSEASEPGDEDAAATEAGQ